MATVVHTAVTLPATTLHVDVHTSAPRTALPVVVLWPGDDTIASDMLVRRLARAGFHVAVTRGSDISRDGALLVRAAREGALGIGVTPLVGLTGPPARQDALQELAASDPSLVVAPDAVVDSVTRFFIRHLG